MKKEKTGRARWFLLLFAVPLLLALPGCQGEDGVDGVDGLDLTAQAPVLVGDFTADVLPLFNQNDKFFEGSMACSACHFDNTAASGHEMNLITYDGILTGADAGAEDIMGRTGACVGQTNVATCPPDWDASGLRHRLRDNRMPPNWPFDFQQGNRTTSEIKALEAWVRDGALATQVNPTAVTYANGDRVGWDTKISDLKLATAADDTTDTSGLVTVGAIVLDGTGVAPSWTPSNPLPAITTATIADLFSKDGVFFSGSEACTNCHNGLSWASHEMNLGTRAGVLAGADAGKEDILGRKNGSGTGQCANTALVVTTAGDGNTCAPVWDPSGLRSRMRNSRMPPGWEFQLGQTNRDMWAIETIGCWVKDGAPNGAYDCTP